MHAANGDGVGNCNCMGGNQVVWKGGRLLPLVLHVSTYFIVGFPVIKVQVSHKAHQVSVFKQYL